MPSRPTARTKGKPPARPEETPVSKPPKTKGEEKREEKREAIMAAAVTVIAREGVHGTTTRKIAGEANVNLGTLHYYFDGKDAVLMNVLTHLVAKSRESLAAYFSAPERLHDRIDHLLTFIRGEVERSPNEQLALFNLTLYAVSTPGSEWLAKRKYEEYLDLYRSVLADASDVRDGSIKSDIDGLANFIFTGFVGILLQWLATANSFRSRQAVQSLIIAAQRAYL
ncbi:TetR family transcriptional regulator [Nitrospirillum viridazoti CBAmc]|uniref:TetR family transcriptional regulator n=1 Tax=Nitrospirillum viridazoti CBAmc TaxID=1441467 RepID=A0A248JVX0_9PROT|nr:TetR family transcriptional regulator [Nitrospirillum amazonense CBAmc]